MKKLLLFHLLLAIPVSFTYSQQSEFPKLTGPYLGQKPPGSTPEIFAPGIVSTEEANIHSSVSFTPDGRLLFFARLYDNPHNAETYSLSEVTGLWQFISLDHSFQDCFSPMLSPDGKTLLLAKKNSLVVSHCNNSIWSPVEILGPEVNFQKRQDGASVSADGTLYYTTMFSPSNRQDGIYCSRRESGRYNKAEQFCTGYTGRPSDGYPFIAPDESYMIFMSWRPGVFGNWDLYIVFKSDNGTWTSPVSMGPAINTAASESFPSVTPDGRYLFFNSNRKSYLVKQQPEHFYGNIYWVSAKIIEELRPKK